MFSSSSTRSRSGHAWGDDWLVDLARNRGSLDTTPYREGQSSTHRSDAADINEGSSQGMDYGVNGSPSPDPWATNRSTNAISTDPISDEDWDDDFGGPGTDSGVSDGGYDPASLHTPRRGPGHPPANGVPHRTNKRPSQKRWARTSSTSTKPSNDAAEVSSLASALKDALSSLQSALSELDDTKALVDHLTSTNDDLQTQRLLLLTQIDDVKNSKDFELECLREQLDQAHFKLRKAERRNRYVDDAERWKADAKYKKKRKVQQTTSSLFGFPSYEPDEHKEDVLKERRGAQGLVAKSVTVVTAMMNRFNEELFQTAASISDAVENMGFERASMLSASRERAERVLGTRVVSMILPTIPKCNNGTLLNPLVVQVVTQAFLAYWCNSIIEAWYPKQETFAEFLVDLSSKLKVGTNRNVCGRKTIVTQKHTRDSDNLFDEWVEDIMGDLDTVLSIFGWRIPQSKPSRSIIAANTSSVSAAIMGVIKEAYDIRTAMAEISTSGDVDLVIVSCDTPYNEIWMDDAYGDYRGRNTLTMDDGMDAHGKTAIESVVATTGIGLQRETWKTDALTGTMSREVDMVLKPRVVLEYTLLEAFTQG